MNFPTVACSGYNDGKIVFVSKSDQASDYHLNYLGTNQTLTYSIVMSNVKGYPSNMTFTGLCSYDNTQSSILMIFENLENRLHRPENNTVDVSFSKLQINGNNPYFSTNESIRLPDTEIISAVNMAAINATPSIAFISKKSKEIALNILHTPLSLTRLATLTEPGVLAADVESNSVYLLQTTAISEYQLTNQIYSTFAVSSHLTPSSESSARVLSLNQTRHILFYEPSTAYLNIYSHQPSLSTYRPLQPNPDRPTLSSASIHPTTASDASASIPTRTMTSSAMTLSKLQHTKRDDPPSAWTVKRVQMKDDEGDGRQHVLSVVTVPGTELEWMAVVEQEGEFSVWNDTIARPTVFPERSASAGRLSAGAIAGIVLGSLAFAALLTGLWLCRRKRRSQTLTPSGDVEKKLRSIKEPVQHAAGLTTRMVQPSLDAQDKRASEITCWNDGRPDIRPLSYVEGQVDFADLLDEEMLELEPERSGPMMLFSGAYKSLPDEPVSYDRQEECATRTFMTDDGRYCSVHYFASSRTETLIRAVYALTAIQSPSVMKSERVILLNSPTPRHGYQSIWITSPTIPARSLQTLFFDTLWSPLDQPGRDNRVWSTLSVIKAVMAVHEHGFVHLAIDPNSFYYDPSTSNWTLGRFMSVQSQGTSLARHRLPQTGCTPPELLTDSHCLHEVTAETDMWSLGCVIYAIATNGLFLFEDFADLQNLMTDMDTAERYVKRMVDENVKDEPFRVLLGGMLVLSPKDRKSIQFALDYWKKMYQLDSS
ncbi:hypothetical protein G6F57_010763 [Rhizopus arrhizus]|nr:hypothetical protein G6F30_010999 [Rhizopus arrhizus]KAG1412016.1 hypothetical protein G6F58_008247 [Rhizopus delemar]KAG0982824.1 hypothetical protein G6F29_006007 [Rhizopus arrhizus]KAG0983902.1 hypothetical protein G6F28_010864 [Rhizopus arrhizus]KAG1003289.1 hypothetical protein G6F27_011184 [Rhizopus arrhizus]